MWVVINTVATVKSIPLCMDMPMAIVENTRVQTLDRALMKRRECKSGSWDIMNWKKPNTMMQ